jgi:hypothetical protein
MPNIHVHGYHCPMKLEKSQIGMCNLPVDKTVLESAPFLGDEICRVDEVRGRERNTTTTTRTVARWVTIGPLRKDGLCDEGGGGQVPFLPPTSIPHFLRETRLPLRTGVFVGQFTDFGDRNPNSISTSPLGLETPVAAGPCDPTPRHGFWCR